MREELAASTYSQAAYAAAGPDVSRVRVPAAAPLTPPVTGASSRRRRCSERRCASRATKAGGVVAETTTPLAHRRGSAGGAEKYLLGLCGIDNEHDQHFASGTDLRRSLGRMAAGARERLAGLESHVAAMHLEAGAQQIARNSLAHGTQADQADAARLRHASISPRSNSCCRMSFFTIFP